MVTRNRCKPLLQVLSQVQEVEYPKDKLDIFLLDGASTDGTVEQVHLHFPQINIISNDKNIGIAACENILIKKVLASKKKYKYIWYLDDDAVIEPQTLLPLINAAEIDRRIAVVGSAVYEPDKRDQLITAGIRVVWKRSGLAYHKPERGEVENLFDTEIVPACSSVTRTDLYRDDQVGLWDEHFWMYWPDNDWCLRALRKGYRICCIGKSRVWHRNWAETKRHFFTPYSIHSSIRGALLFYLRHNPLHSVASVRNYILKCYLRGALECLTLRPNFALAYDEGVQDFLRGHLGEKNFSAWGDGYTPLLIEQICKQLVGKLPENPRIILNQITNEAQKTKIIETLSKYFPKIRSEHIQDKTGNGRLDARESLRDCLLYHLPSFFLHPWSFFNRVDLIISPIDLLDFQNISVAKHTIFLDSNLCCCIRRNRVFKSLLNSLRLIIKGLKAAYFDLPHSLRSCMRLKNSISYYDISRASPPGLEDRNVKVM